METRNQATGNKRDLPLEEAAESFQDACVKSKSVAQVEEKHLRGFTSVNEQRGFGVHSED